MIEFSKSDSGQWCPSVKGDTTARVLAKIIRIRPKVGVQGMSPNGTIQFGLWYGALAITHHDMRKMALMRYRGCINFLGEFLIQINLDRFLPLITQCDFAGHVSRCYSHQIGYKLDDEKAIFTINVGLLYHVFNEQLAKLIEGENSWVALSWDFLKRHPRNPTL